MRVLSIESTTKVDNTSAADRKRTIKRLVVECAFPVRNDDAAVHRIVPLVLSMFAILVIKKQLGVATSSSTDGYVFVTVIIFIV